MKILKTANYKKVAAKRGTFKYKCDDCEEFTYLTPRDRSRSGIPRCRYCGSTWLDPVTNDALDRIQGGRDFRNNQMESNKQKQNF